MTPSQFQWAFLIRFNFHALLIAFGACFATEAAGIIPPSHKDLTLSLTGEVQDVRITLEGNRITNNLSFTGVWADEKFLLDVTPIKTEDDVAESVGWDGVKFRMIQRYPSERGIGKPRDGALARVESSVFSHYATPPTTALLLALAGKGALTYLQSGQEAVIFGAERICPEEENKYTVQYDNEGGVTITAMTPGRMFDGNTEELLPDFKDGFTRWVFACRAPGLRTGKSDAENIYLTVDYRRFIPESTKLFMFRHVTGKIYATQALSHKVSADFRPEIREASLRVWDHSTRRELFPLLKGIVDYQYGYKLTERNWSFDESAMRQAVEKMKANLGQKGLPKGYLPAPVRDLTTGRTMTLSFMAIISVGFLFLFLRSRQEIQKNPSNATNNK